jgi:hypothetical protein
MHKSTCDEIYHLQSHTYGNLSLELKSMKYEPILESMRFLKGFRSHDVNSVGSSVLCIELRTLILEAVNFMKFHRPFDGG